MRKLVGIIAALFLILAVFYFLKGSKNKPSEVTKNQPANEQAEAESDSKTKSSHGRRWTRAIKGAVTDPDSFASLPTNAVVHRTPDFNRGDAQNLRVTDEGLEMGDDPGFVPRFNPDFQRFGIFVSPEEFSTDPFYVILPFLEMTTPEKTGVTFEIRTKQEDNVWTTWQEINVSELKKPMKGGRSTAWQYRLTLFGNDPTAGPKVHGVGIVLEKAPSSEPAPTP